MPYKIHLYKGYPFHQAPPQVCIFRVTNLDGRKSFRENLPEDESLGIYMGVSKN